MSAARGESGARGWGAEIDASGTSGRRHFAGEGHGATGRRVRTRNHGRTRCGKSTPVHWLSEILQFLHPDRQEELCNSHRNRAVGIPKAPISWCFNGSESGCPLMYSLINHE
ncbi:hypothetical protein Y1Q_0009635 [Alligator mississippiensis]|uniref:Uncharacterized protein n=1 Tax=Alligator mississippiensis TaxID=8496 RepID=A0A151NVC7_ALLMI|nr:hypothetical protein Y1Q_0009635 [Alligator mississippiensis]